MTPAELIVLRLMVRAWQEELIELEDIIDPSGLDLQQLQKLPAFQCLLDQAYAEAREEGREQARQEMKQEFLHYRKRKARTDNRN